MSEAEDEIREKAESKLARARAIVRKNAPYIMRTVYGFVPLMVPGLKTMGVSRGLVLAVDPFWLISIEDKHVAAALFHEAEHVVREHLPRIEKMPDKDMANAAADLTINPWMRSAGWELPHGIFPEDYNFPEGLMMEEYYKLLDKRKQQQQKQQQQQGGGKGKGKQPQPQGQKQQSDGQGDDGQQGGGPKGDPQPGQQAPANGQGPSGGQQPSQGQQPGGGPGQQQGQNQQQNGQGGQGSSAGMGQHPAQGQGGVGRNHALPEGKTPGIGSGCCGGIAGKPVTPFDNKINEEHGRSDIDQKRIIKATLEDIKQHVEKHGRGSVPGGLLQSIDVTEKKSEIRWQDKFRHILKRCTARIEAGGMDYSLSRPSKRSYVRGFPRPGLVQYMPEVVFILDTSLSMGAQQIIDSLIESIGIMKSLGIDTVWLIQADTSVATKPLRVRIRDLMGKVKIHGRGGTNFDPALRYASTRIRPKPDLIVYFTDGDGHVSYKPKGIEVVWCVVRNHWNRKPPCDWGHTVIIADESKQKPPLRAPRTA